MLLDDGFGSVTAAGASRWLAGVGRAEHPIDFECEKAGVVFQVPGVGGHHMANRLRAAFGVKCLSLELIFGE